MSAKELQAKWEKAVASRQKLRDEFEDRGIEGRVVLSGIDANNLICVVREILALLVEKEEKP